MNNFNDLKSYSGFINMGFACYINAFLIHLSKLDNTISNNLNHDFNHNLNKPIANECFIEIKRKTK